MQMSEATCVSCNRAIDAAAKVCPYCGSDPRTGEKVIDTQAIVQEVFQSRKVSTTESVMDYARQRQGVVIAVGALVLFVILGALHQFVTMRNASAVTTTAAVPLTDLVDVNAQNDNARPVEMPEIKFQYDGRPQVMRTPIVEAGAATPPEILAAQQAAAQAAQQAAQQAARPAVQPAVQPARPATQPQQR